MEGIIGKVEEAVRVLSEALADLERLTAELKGWTAARAPIRYVGNVRGVPTFLKAIEGVKSNLVVIYGLRLGEVSKSFESWVAYLPKDKCFKVTDTADCFPFLKATHAVRLDEDDVLLMVNLQLLKKYNESKLGEFLTKVGACVPEGLEGYSCRTYKAYDNKRDKLLMVRSLEGAVDLLYIAGDPMQSHFQLGGPREAVRAQAGKAAEGIEAVANLMPTEEEILALVSLWLGTGGFAERLEKSLDVWRGVLGGGGDEK